MTHTSTASIVPHLHAEVWVGVHLDKPHAEVLVDHEIVPKELEARAADVALVQLVAHAQDAAGRQAGQ